VSFIVFQSLVTVSLFTIIKIYIFSIGLSCRSIRIYGGMEDLRIIKKFVLRNAVQFLRNSKKSFLRERSVSFLLKSRSEGNAELTAKNKR
jgi:hypothetical protein